MTRKKLKPPPVGTVVTVEWVDSGYSRSQASIRPSEAFLSLAHTTGEVVVWQQDRSCLEKNVCVLRTSTWSPPDKETAGGGDDLFSIWIPSIIEIKEYTEKLSKKK